MLIKQRLNKYINTIYSFIKKKYFIFSLTSSILLIVLSYFANNIPLFTGESTLKYYVVQNISELFGFHKKVKYGDAVYYNVSYDKMLIPAINDGDTLGNYVITDRQKLFRFLKMLEKTDQYKYVIIDLTFDKNHSSIYDDSLFSQIQKMRNIVVANHTKIAFADSNLERLGKTGLVTFFTTSVSTNFGRFEYLLNEEKTLPLVVYQNLNSDKSMRRHGFGYLSYYKIGEELCQNSCYLTFDNSYVEPEINKLNDKLYLQTPKYINLGSFIDDPIYNEDLLHNLIKTNTNNKYVVIGDFKGDLHDTYVGQMPGSVIIMRALATLEEGGNIVYFSHVFLWFIAFFVINLFILYNKPISCIIPYIRNISYKWFHFVFSLLSFGFVLVVCSIIEYLCDYAVYSLMIPILYFTILKLYVQYKIYSY